MRIPFIMKKEDERNKPLDLDGVRNRFLQIVPDPRNVTKEQERIAAFKNFGGLPSIPNDIPSLPFGGAGHREAAAVLSAIAIMQLLRGMRSAGSNPMSRAVAQAETLSARALRPLSAPMQRGVGRTTGRGGLHVNAARDLRNLLFGRSRKQRRPGAGLSAGFDAFSETGFP